MRNPSEDHVRDAIELMTAWLDKPNGPPDLMIDCLRNHIEGDPEQDRLAAAIELIMGQTQLCGSLLLLIEESTGIAARETLHQLALHYAQD